MLSNNNLNFKSNVLKSSCIGGVFSLLIATIFIIINYKTTLAFINKENPTIYWETVSKTFDSTVSLKEKYFPFAFSIHDILFNKVEEPTSFYFNSFISAFKINKENTDDGLVEVFYRKKLNLTNCDKVPSYYKTKIYDLSKDGFYCIDYEDYYLKGNWENDYTSYIELELNLCLEGETNPYTNEQCASEKKTEEYFLQQDAIYFEFFTPSFEINRKNLDNGFDKTLVLNTIYLDYKLKRAANLYYSEAIMISDIGYIFQDYRENREYYLDKKDTDSFYRFDNKLAIIYLQYYSDSQKYYYRNFMKIDQLLGQFGGVFQVIVFFVHLLNNIYSDYLLYFRLIPYLYKWKFSNFDTLRRRNLNSKLKNEINNIYNENNVIDQLKVVSFKSESINVDQLSFNIINHKDELKLKENDLHLTDKNETNLRKSNKKYKDSTNLLVKLSDKNKSFDNDKSLDNKNNCLNSSIVKSKNCIDIDFKVNNNDGKPLPKNFTNNLMMDKDNLSNINNNLEDNKYDDSFLSVYTNNTRNYEKCLYNDIMKTKINNILVELGNKTKRIKEEIAVKKSAYNEFNFVLFMILRFLYIIKNKEFSIQGVHIKKIVYEYNLIKKEVSEKLEIKSYLKCLLTQEVIKYFLLDKSQINQIEDYISY